MEYLDIVDENNELTGIVESRKTAHENGLWHRHVSSWIMNKNGEILLQKRAACKERNPNKWAKTGGHVDSGESVENAIRREVKEEIGIEIPQEQINVLEIQKSTHPTNKYFVYNFLFITDAKIEDFRLQKEEVAEVKYFRIEELEEARKKNLQEFTFCAWEEKGFYKEMDLLKRKRNEIFTN